MVSPLKPMTSHMGAFHIAPHVRFESQYPDESVMLMLRAHPITQIPWLVRAFLLLLLLIVVDFFLPLYFRPSQVLFINLIWIAGVLSYGWLNFILYYFTVGIVTNQRILDIDFHGILSKEVTESRIKNVEDITSKMQGYIGSLFHFGNVYVQTAGTEMNIEFDRVPEPAMIVKIINSLLEKAQES